jgi:hypothetical protein
MDAGHGLREVSEFWSIDDIAERLEWLDAVDELKTQQVQQRQAPGGGTPPFGGFPFGR